MDVAAIRRQFPVTERMVFLNNAAESPLSLPVRRRLDEYLDQAACAPDRRPPARQPVRPLLSRLLGGSADEYALVTSTGVGLGLAAAGYAWVPGDNVVVPAGEHWNNTFPWLALRTRGVDVRVVPLGADQRLDPAPGRGAGGRTDAHGRRGGSQSPDRLSLRPPPPERHCPRLRRSLRRGRRAGGGRRAAECRRRWHRRAGGRGIQVASGPARHRLRVRSGEARGTAFSLSCQGCSRPRTTCTSSDGCRAPSGTKPALWPMRSSTHGRPGSR